MEDTFTGLSEKERLHKKKVQASNELAPSAQWPPSQGWREGIEVGRVRRRDDQRTAENLERSRWSTEDGGTRSWCLRRSPTLRDSGKVQNELSVCR
jgi:hypothetical protein